MAFLALDDEMTPKSRRLIALLLCAGILALLALREVAAYRAAQTAIGVAIVETEEGVVIDEVFAGRPADLADLAPGDLLIAVDGEPVTDFAGYDAAAESFERGWPVELLVERDGRDQLRTVKPGVRYPDLAETLNVLACLSFLALALLALGKAGRKRPARLLAIYASSIALELALPVSLPWLPGFDTWSFPFLSLLIGLQIGLELHLAASIPEHRLRHLPGVPSAFYVAGLSLGVFYSFTQVALAMDWPLPWSETFADHLFWNFGMTFWAVAVVALLAAPALRWPQPVGRQQAALVLLGVLPWSALVVVSLVRETILGLPTWWLAEVEALVLLIYPLAIFLAIFKYQLFDLELVVKRGVIYGALALLLLLAFYGALVVTGLVVSLWLTPSQGSMLAVAIGGLLLGLLFGPLRGSLMRLVEQRLFPERQALRAQLIELASELPALGDLGAMGSELVDRLCEIFELHWAAVLLAEGESGLLVALETSGLERKIGESLVLSPDDEGIAWLRSSHRPMEARRLAARSEILGRRLRLFEAELLVPLLRKSELVGLFVLSRKKFGDPFRAEEKELLSLLSHHVASVFENARLFQSATRDSLTGLLRREAILEALDHELRRAVRFGRPLTVGMADLDHFKRINDRHGHLVGDLLLKRVAQAMTRSLRATDLVGRYGGEEFLLVLTETDLKGAMTVSEKLRQRVEEVEVSGAAGPVRVTLSVGLAAVDRRRWSGELGVVDLVELADRALYGAKSAGRNRIDSLPAERS